MSTPRKSLGRGLGNLIADSATPPAHAPASSLPYQEILVSKITPARWQARREFDEISISGLAESIQSEGLLQPIIVRKTNTGFELIAGERRWRAFQKLALKSIPARIVEASDAATAVMTLVENLQREDLNPLDEALGLASLMRDFNLTQDAVAERVGKPRGTIANSIRLLSLDRETQGYLASGLLSVGHAKVLLSMDSADTRALVARRVIESGASVRATEALVKKFSATKFAPEPSRSAATPDARNTTRETEAIADIEKRLTSRLNTKVNVKHNARHGKIIIEYHGNDDLMRVLEKLGVN
jgi:ParB family chromosome partitioning protein